MLLIRLITHRLTEQIPSRNSKEGFWQGRKDRAAWQGTRRELRSGRRAQEHTGGHQGEAIAAPSSRDTLAPSSMCVGGTASSFHPAMPSMGT